MQNSCDILSSLDNTYLSEGDSKTQIDIGSPRNQKVLFSRKPAVEYCRKIREAKSRLDCSGQFAGFYSPTHNDRLAAAIKPDQIPAVKVFMLQSPKAPKQPIRRYKQQSAASQQREPLKQATTNQFQLYDVENHQPMPSEYGLDCQNKENQPLAHDPTKLNRQISLLQKELCHCRQENKGLKQENQRLKSEISKLKSQLQQINSQYQRLSMDNYQIIVQRDEAWQQITNLKDQIMDYERVSRHLKMSLDTQSEELTKKDHIISHLRQQTSELKNQMEYIQFLLQCERHSLHNQLKYRDIELQTMKRRRYDVERLEKSENENRRLVEANKKLKISVMELKEMVSQMRGSRRDLDIFQLSPQRD